MPPPSLSGNRAMNDLNLARPGAIGNDRPVRARFPAWLAPALGLGVVALAVGGVMLWPGGQTVEARQITTAVAEETRFSSLVVFAATVSGEQGDALVALEGGVLEEILKRNGDRVASDDVVAVISNPELRRSVDEALFRIEGQVAELGERVAGAEGRTADAERAYREAQYRVRVHEADLARYETLETRGFVSSARMTRLREDAAFALREVSAAEQRLLAAQRREAAIRAEADRSRLRLGERSAAELERLRALELRAPQSGVVSGLSASAGASLSPGATVARISYGPSSSIEAQVLDDQASRLRIGGQAHLMEEPQRRLRVIAIDPEVRNGQVAVRLEFIGEPPPTLRAGQTLQVAFETGAPRQAIVVPQGDAIAPDGVWVIDRSGRRAERRAVTLGERAAGRVEIRSGISAGERVLVSSSKDLSGLREVRISQ